MYDLYPSVILLNPRKLSIEKLVKLLTVRNFSTVIINSIFWRFDRQNHQAVFLCLFNLIDEYIIIRRRLTAVYSTSIINAISPIFETHLS